MADLTTKYLGLTLSSPLVASPSPQCEDIDNIRQMEDAGAAAVVLHSLFEEQIQLESLALDTHLSYGEQYAEAMSYYPDLNTTHLGPDLYLEHIRKAKEAVDIPIIGSLNGVSTGGWIEYAEKFAQAGADALELNMYFIPTDPNIPAAEVEEMYCRLLRDVKAGIDIPVAVKLGHHFTSIPDIGRKLNAEGADALVLFNRFYQPDFDLEKLEIKSTLTLSSPYEILLRLHWVAILHAQIKADLAVTGGVHDHIGVLKSMMAGAKVAMMTSAILQNGIGHFARVKQDLANWMEDKEYDSITQMQGSMSYGKVENPGAFQRGNYMKVVSSHILRDLP